VACFCDKNRGVNPAQSFRAGGGGAACVIYLLGGVAVALCLEQAGDESPTPVLLPTLLASTASVTFFEGIVVALLQPITHYPAGALASSSTSVVFRHAAGCWGGTQLCLLCLLCVPLLWVVLLHLTSPTLFLADALPQSLGRMLCRQWLFGPSLVDALLLRVCWPASRRMLFHRDRLVRWRMLCRRGRLVRWRMLCRRCCSMHVLLVDALPPRLGLLRRKPLHWYFIFAGTVVVLGC
jgi:hypothetical protein